MAHFKKILSIKANKVGSILQLFNCLWYFYSMTERVQSKAIAIFQKVLFHLSKICDHCSHKIILF